MDLTDDDIDIIEKKWGRACIFEVTSVQGYVISKLWVDCCRGSIFNIQSQNDQ